MTDIPLDQGDTLPMLDNLVKRLSAYSVVHEPDKDEPEWWAGAPSVARDDAGVFYLACRMREGESPRGQRGYEIRFLRSEDGVRFETVHSIKREEVGVTGFERPALVRDPITGDFRLYGCTGYEKGWAILRWDDARTPADFKADTARPVLQADNPDDGFSHVTGYKDPVVYRDGNVWRMFVIGTDRIERIHQFVSSDGDTWEPAPATLPFENTGWHNFATRPACVLPMTVGYLFVYEGSRIGWRDPVYNIATGLAFTTDFQTFIDLTPDAPLFKSTTPGQYHTWRYSHWMQVGERIHVYFEAARPNNSNEIRLATFPAAHAG